MIGRARLADAVSDDDAAGAAESAVGWRAAPAIAPVHAMLAGTVSPSSRCSKIHALLRWYVALQFPAVANIVALP